jgi:pimeloyl-ACP methyl ester carboxylesterase
MPTFVLIHGGAHDSSCWELLTPELEARGHRVITMAVPVYEPDLGYAGAVDSVAAAVGGARDTVIVGHSLGGSYLPLVAGRVAARLMIFLCAQVPREGMSRRAQMAAEPGMVPVPYERFLRDDLGRIIIPPDVAKEIFYQDCDPELADRAARKLLPQGVGPMFTEPFPLGGWPEVPGWSILCTDDRCVSPDWSRGISVELLGRPAIELPGSHSPFLSRPGVLADTLESLV